MTGVVNSVSSCETSRPPTMAMPSGRRSSEPVPWPSASGSAAEQRRHGRHQDRAGSAAGRPGRSPRRGDRPSLALRLEREVDHHDRVLLHDADEQDDADERDDAEARCLKSSSASSAPTPADGSVDRIVIGWMKLS